MSILKHKDLIIAWLNGSTVQFKNKTETKWTTLLDSSRAYAIFIYENNDIEYRIKPKTETTWIWVAEWDYHKETCMRSTKNPWINDTGDYSLVKPLKVYKIEESKQETLIE